LKIPRDCNGSDLARVLTKLGYEVVRQTGSHARMTTQRGGEHHVTLPNHRPLRAGLLKDVAAHHGVTVEQLVRDLAL
jgi:predicted RNA binding protein YcfA (HicA-like mRNA interferase family)